MGSPGRISLKAQWPVVALSVSAAGPYSEREGRRVEGLSDWTVGQPDEGSERAYLLTVNGTAAHLNNTRG